MRKQIHPKRMLKALTLKLRLIKKYTDNAYSTAYSRENICHMCVFIFLINPKI